MLLVVDPWDWLDENGYIPYHLPRLRRRMLHVARIIEYGGPLARGETQLTLIECPRRPGRVPCMGLLFVQKLEDDGLLAYCPECRTEQILVHNWQDTLWAEGVPMPLSPLPPDEDAGGR